MRTRFRGLRSPFSLIACLSLMILGACAPVVERVHLRLRETLDLDASGTLSMPAPRIVNGRPETETTAINGAETCLDARIRQRIDGGRIYYSVQRDSLPSSVFRELLGCLVRAEWAMVQVRRTDGIFSVTYILTLRLPEIPQSDPDGDKGQFLPSTLSISMPGDSISIEDISSRRVVDMTVDKISPVDANVSLRIPHRVLQQAFNESQNLCPGGSNCPAYTRALRNGEWPVFVPVVLEIKSVKYKYGVNELLALAALLFGSGVVIGGGRWLASRRRLGKTVTGRRPGTQRCVSQML